MRTKLFLLFFSLTVFNFFSANVALADDTLLIEVLERKDCVHCQAEKAFLLELQKTRDDFSVVLYDIDADGKELFNQITEAEKIPKATPITIVGGVIIQGFEDSKTTGKRFEELLDNSKGKKQISFSSYLKNSSKNQIQIEKVKNGACDDGTVCKTPGESFFVRIPIIGKIVDVSLYSLPMLAVVLGFVDGFNPCAMWVLVTFLLILSQTKSRKKLVQIAGLFIVAEAIMYYFILNVWFTAWNFIGLDRIITPIVGIIAIGGGLFFLYEWYKSLGTKIACQIIDIENRSKIVKKIKTFVTGEFTIFVAISIIGLAFTVNVIEFACSIGIPQAFTKILELNDLGFVRTQVLMLLYILLYMVDDILVFGLAVWGFGKLHLSEKYSQWSALIGGLLMLLLGYLLIFRPEIINQLG